jgi:YVTN family beta-propeller protein
MDETSLRGLLESALGDEPPIGPVARNALRAGIKLRRRARMRRAAGGTAVVIAMAAVIPAATGALGHTAPARPPAPKPSPSPRPWVPPDGTAYVINSGGGTVTPIDLATNTAERPIDVSGEPVTMTIAPDGKTVYVGDGAANGDAEPTMQQTITAIDVAANTAGKPVDLQWPPDSIVITPDSKTAYIDNGFPSRTVTPIDLVTSTVGKPITLSEPPQAIAMGPHGEAYIAIQTGSMTSHGYRAWYDFMSADLATGKLGKPVRLSGEPEAIAITPNGKTAYLTIFSTDSVTPIELATGKAGKPIRISGKPLGNNVAGQPLAIAITPDGRTAYVTNGASGIVMPIDLATNTAGKPIHIRGKPGADAIAISPDGTTAYVANQPSSTVTPIDLATGTPEKPIDFGHGWDSGFEAIVIAP